MLSSEDMTWGTPQKKKKKGADFTFIDLFAGIGGIRMGFESAGGECVFTSEWDEPAQKIEQKIETIKKAIEKIFVV